VHDKTQELTIDYERIGRNGKVRLTARLPDGATYTDKVDVTDADGRQRFVRGLRQGRKGLDRKVVASTLEKIAGQLVAQAPTDGKNAEAESSRGRPSQADMLVALAHDLELFHTPGGYDSEGYATIIVNGHHETWPFNSKGFRRWLSKQFYDAHGKAPGSQAVQDALAVIGGKAIHDGPEHDIAVRVAEHEGALWLDLADVEWRAVKISADGWAVVRDPPVRFVRRRGMLPLPEPVRGGSINELRALVNLPDYDAWMLFVAWLLAALRPGRPFPILVVNGEQGSAKTTLCKMARALIDANVAPLRRPPREDRDLMIAATNGWFVAYDNLSGIEETLSDALCLLATGGGFGTRELYTDNDEKLFDAKRPIMVNGIEDLATRADLMDRAINLTLPVIGDEQRRDEDELWQGFEDARPRILGALLDAVSAALRNRPSVKLAAKPRMADFALWVVAAGGALGWSQEDFLEAYKRNRGATNAQALEGSRLAPVVFALMKGRGSWQGVLKDLLAELERHADEPTRKRQDWPSSPRVLSGQLRRLAPNFRQAGLQVQFGKHTKKGTPVTLEWAGNSPSPSSPAPPSNSDKDLGGDETTDTPSPAKPLGPRPGEGGDDGDGVSPSHSAVPESGEEPCEWTG
jgi:hypothetical protein